MNKKLFFIILVVLFFVILLFIFKNQIKSGLIGKWGEGALDHLDINEIENSSTSWGITNNGTYFWITGYDLSFPYEDNKVYKYLMNGTYVGYFKPANIIRPYDITNDNEYLWIVDYGTNAIYKYLMNGTYVGYFKTTDENGDPYAITQDGTYLWVADYLDKIAYKYKIDGTYTGQYFSFSEVSGSVKSMANDGTYFWLSASNGVDAVYKYLMDGTYVKHFENNDTKQPHGITYDGNYFWILDSEGVKKFDLK